VLNEQGIIRAHRENLPEANIPSTAICVQDGRPSDERAVSGIIPIARAGLHLKPRGRQQPGQLRAGRHLLPATRGPSPFPRSAAEDRAVPERKPPRPVLCFQVFIPTL